MCYKNPLGLDEDGSHFQEEGHPGFTYYPATGPLAEELKRFSYRSQSYSIGVVADITTLVE